MKTGLLILLAFLIQTLSFGQAKDCWDDSLWRNCEEYIQKDSVVYNRQAIQYYLVYKMVSYRDVNGDCRFDGVIVIPDLPGKVNKRKLKDIFPLINEKLQLNSFGAYSTCEAFQLSRTAFSGRAKTKFLKKYHLGNFKVKRFTQK